MDAECRIRVIYRVWVGRDWRVLYSTQSDRNELVIEAVRRKDERTYRRRGQRGPV